MPELTDEHSSNRAIHFDNQFLSLPEHFYTRLNPQGLTTPVFASVNHKLAAELGLPDDLDQNANFLKAMSGNALLEGSEPIAMKYTGHQFGYYNPDLGDGRGLLLGEQIDRQGRRWDWHLKGAGLTPYSRQGDGRAVLRSSIREYLCGEAMHHLGIASTRALCVVASREKVYREKPETGAMLLRIASTHIRFGHFEYCYYRKDEAGLRHLADHVILTHFPQWQDLPDKYERLLRNAIQRTATMIAKWQAVGFCHGVMNTDNMSILGDTFDFGPFAFLDDFQANYICNRTDTGGRYAFNNQPNIGLWNCQCLAQAMLPLLGTHSDGEQIAIRLLKEYEPAFQMAIVKAFRAKLGLQSEQENDHQLIQSLLNLMHANKVDYTRFFRNLCEFHSTQEHGDLRDHFVDREAFDIWSQQYGQRLANEPIDRPTRESMMLQSNPKFILRNYLAQRAIERAEKGDFSEIGRLLTLLQAPFDEHEGFAAYTASPPDDSKGIALSCSS
ncbi:MAG: YdiU family protein [Hahellaceae bacterium]|nr:YdiU family protein [Hahellaceae bacterium]MCP5169011.1 YdiU family protein [Hahellaceae bacterium]